MTTDQNGGASSPPEGGQALPDSIDELEAQLVDLRRLKAEQAETARRLMAEEDPAKGLFFAQEIHRARQDKLRLEVEIQFRVNKINRLRQGLAEQAPQGLFGP